MARRVKSLSELPKPAEAKIIRWERLPEDTEFEKNVAIRHAVNYETCGASRISVSRSVLTPGMINERHIHNLCETVMVILSGEPVLFLGEEGREERVTPGTFIYIPQGYLHSIGNPHRTKNVEFIVCTSIYNKEVNDTVFVEEPNFPPKNWAEKYW